jgi:hypothetical protein
MGVEEVYVDAFTRAKEYKAARAVKGNTTRRDLELEALAEILDANALSPVTLTYSQKLTC